MIEEVQKENKWIKGVSRFFILVGIFLIALFIGSFLATVVVSLSFGLSLTEVAERLQAVIPNTTNRYIYFIFQSITALVGFVGTSLVFMSFIEKKPLEALQEKPQVSSRGLLLTVLFMLVFLPFVSWVAYWNAHLDLPDVGGFEAWARRMEDQIKALTLFLVDFQNFGEYFTALIVIAVLPAIGEELLFRGVLQRNLDTMFSTHLAIWLTAILFSALHGQFYGFFPRTLLGALFGYIYVWSGNLWLSILAHFINNALGLTLIYLYKINLIEYNAASEDKVPILIALSSLVLSLGIIFYLRKHFTQNPRPIR